MSMSKLQFKPSYDGARVRKRGYRNRQVWDDHKDFILNLLQEKVNQQTIVRVLQSERGFETNLNQLKSQLAIWRISKRNLKQKQRKWIAQTKQARELEGKKTRFIFQETGLEIAETQLASIFRLTEPNFPSHLAASPGGIEAITPPPDSSVTNDSRDLESTPETNPGEQQYNQFTPSTSPEDAVDVVVKLEPPSDLPLEGCTQVSDSAAPVQSAKQSLLEIPSMPSPKATPLNLDDIYDKILARLNSLTLTTDFTATESLPYPEQQSSHRYSLRNEYTKELKAWIQDIREDADIFMEGIYETMASTGLSFSVCRDAMDYFCLTQDGYSLTYHVYSAIVEGVPIQPIANRLEDPQRMQELLRGPVRYTGVVNPAASMPIQMDRLFSNEEWERIDAIHDKHYKALVDVCNKVWKFDPEVEFIGEFRSKAAHLQTLRHTLGEFNYFTIEALGAFASVIMQLTMQDVINDAIFLLECSLKAYNYSGLGLDRRAVDNHDLLGYLRKTQKDFSKALECYEAAYEISKYVSGAESIESVQRIPYILRTRVKLGWTKEGEALLRQGFADIKLVMSKLTSKDFNDHYTLGETVYELSRVLRQTSREGAADAIIKVALQQYSKYKEQYVGTEVGRLGWVPLRVGQAHIALKDYDNAIRDFHTAFDRFAVVYGLRDMRTVETLRDLCRIMRRRGPVLYTLPILEKMWHICEDSGDGEQDGATFEAWVSYARVKFQLSGHQEGLNALRKQLAF